MQLFIWYGLIGKETLILLLVIVRMYATNL